MGVVCEIQTTPGLDCEASGEGRRAAILIMEIRFDDSSALARAFLLDLHFPIVVNIL
jgi:hypothetical protein